MLLLLLLLNDATMAATEFAVTVKVACVKEATSDDDDDSRLPETRKRA